ncbi:unnamed protein product [Adineta ricciae]|uniref:Uncharacterized protein n=1 Tax=Adineta ricciae TaxID=249248 RepID=A0A815TZB8_ADIRI|nr:unnamed protein product [Adineta ricciae]CAF1510671.1 unnamed protein product [Adineta ricciae]
MNNLLPLQDQENINPTTCLTNKEEKDVLHLITQLKNTLNSVQNSITEIQQGLNDLSNKIQKQDEKVQKLDEKLQKLAEELNRVKHMCQDNSSDSTSSNI